MGMGRPGVLTAYVLAAACGVGCSVDRHDHKEGHDDHDHEEHAHEEEGGDLAMSVEEVM